MIWTTYIYMDSSIFSLQNRRFPGKTAGNEEDHFELQGGKSTKSLPNASFIAANTLVFSSSLDSSVKCFHIIVILVHVITDRVTSI